MSGFKLTDAQKLALVRIASADEERTGAPRDGRVAMRTAEILAGHGLIEILPASPADEYFRSRRLVVTECGRNIAEWCR